MSKAFTSEENEDTGLAGRAVLRAAPGEERPITPEGHRALVDRRDALALARAEVVATVTADRDVRLRELDHRLALVAVALDSVRIVEASPPDGVARFGATVTIEWDDGRTQRARLVGPDDPADAAHLSVSSPLARAVIGLRVGEPAEVELPRGTVTVTLRAVE